MQEPELPTTPDTPEPQPRPKRRSIAWLLALVICVALAVPLLMPHMPPGGMPPGGPPGGGPPGAAGGKAPKGMPAGGPPGMGGGSANAGVSVTTAKVQSGSMDIYLDALGTVTPVATVNVYSQASGRVLSVNYREGQMVHKGQVLVEIDPRPVQAQIQQVQGSLARDQALLSQARTNLTRYQDALKEHAIAEQTAFDQAAAVKQYEGTVANDQGQLDYYKVQLSYCHILAPITGRIGLRLVDSGNTVFSGSGTTIATITQVDPITTVFSVAEDHLPTIEQRTGKNRGGLPVVLYDRSQATKLSTGRLLTMDNQVDTSTGTVRLRALFNNPDEKLYPNQFVNARLQVNTLPNAKLLPTVAVQYNGQQAFVYVVNTNNTASLRNIRVLNTETGQTAIDGLNLNDEVVTSNFDRLTDGAKVTVGQAGMPMGPM